MLLHAIHNVQAFLEAFESCKIKTTIGAMCKCYDQTFEMVIGISFFKDIHHRFYFYVRAIVMSSDSKKRLVRSDHNHAKVTTVF